VTAYQRGNYFERRVADDLRHDGYLVFQSRGSKTVVDIVAIKPRQVLLIQAKAGLTPPTSTEWNSLYLIARSHGALALIADRAGKGRIRYRRITAAHTARSHDWPAAPWTADDDELAAAITRHPAGKQRPR
jgi:Holliday junction resolvase